MKVIFSEDFQQRLLQFDNDKRQAVLQFVAHVKQHGLKGLAGRNKSSTLPNPFTKRQKADFEYAQKNCLWHYHIGIPHYVGEYGDMTSEYILHYQRFDDRIVLLDITAHLSFMLPTICESDF